MAETRRATKREEEATHIIEDNRSLPDHAFASLATIEHFGLLENVDIRPLLNRSTTEDGEFVALHKDNDEHICKKLRGYQTDQRRPWLHSEERKAGGEMPAFLFDRALNPLTWREPGRVHGRTLDNGQIVVPDKWANKCEIGQVCMKGAFLPVADVTAAEMREIEKHSPSKSETHKRAQYVLKAFLEASEVYVLTLCNAPALHVARYGRKTFACFPALGGRLPLFDARRRGGLMDVVRPHDGRKGLRVVLEYPWQPDPMKPPFFIDVMLLLNDDPIHAFEVEFKGENSKAKYAAFEKYGLANSQLSARQICALSGQFVTSGDRETTAEGYEYKRGTLWLESFPRGNYRPFVCPECCKEINDAGGTEELVCPR